MQHEQVEHMMEGLIESHKAMEVLFYKLQQRERRQRVALERQLAEVKHGLAPSVPGAPPEEVPAMPAYPMPYRRGRAGADEPVGYHQNPGSGAVWEIQLSP